MRDADKKRQKTENEKRDERQGSDERTEVSLEPHWEAVIEAATD